MTAPALISQYDGCDSLAREKKSRLTGCAKRAECSAKNSERVKWKIVSDLK